LLERYEALHNQVILDVIIPMIYPQFLMRWMWLIYDALFRGRYASSCSIGCCTS
jgi:hypothetical protein